MSEATAPAGRKSGRRAILGVAAASMAAAAVTKLGSSGVAEAAGSPVVLETHVLGALLALRSASLDLALARLGVDQWRLARALRDQDDGSDAAMSTMHGGR